MHFAPSAPSKVKDKSYELHIQFFTVHSIVPMVIFLVPFHRCGQEKLDRTERPWVTSSPTIYRLKCYLMENWREWRRQQRARLIACRKQIPKAERENWSEAITSLLIQGFPVLQQRSVGFYSPHQGEYDPAPVMVYLFERGATLALPEVIGLHQPLRFRKWWPDAPMREDAYGIAIPHDTEQVNIDAVMIPMIGFDNQGYRLGYGSGFFDRTLAAIHPRPLTIGIAFELLHLPTTYPHEHDIAMDYIVTEKTIYYLNNGMLQPISSGVCASMNTLK